MKKFLQGEWLRFRGGMFQEYQPDVRNHRGFGDSLALCMVAIVGVVILMVT